MDPATTRPMDRSRQVDLICLIIPVLVFYGPSHWIPDNRCYKFNVIFSWEVIYSDLTLNDYRSNSHDAFLIYGFTLQNSLSGKKYGVISVRRSLFFVRWIKIQNENSRWNQWLVRMGRMCGNMWWAICPKPNSNMFLSTHGWNFYCNRRVTRMWYI